MQRWEGFCEDHRKIVRFFFANVSTLSHTLTLWWRCVLLWVHIQSCLSCCFTGVTEIIWLAQIIRSKNVLFVCCCVFVLDWIAWVKMPQGLPCGLVSEEHKKRHLARAFAAFLAWTSLLMRMVSRLTGLGTKPTMPSSFTGRPIHQSLLNFCMWKKKEQDLSAAFQQPSRHATVRWTSLTWRKSRASKVMAWPGTGTLSSSAGV